MEVYKLESDIDLMMLKPAPADLDELFATQWNARAWSHGPLSMLATGWGGKPEDWVLADFPYYESLPQIPVSSYAQRALKSSFEGCGYWIDTNVDLGNGPYRVFFATLEVPAFNEKLSGYGNIWGIHRYELDESLLPRSGVFRMNGCSCRNFVTSEFAEAIDRFDLVGAKLTRIWSTETGGIDISQIGMSNEVYSAARQKKARRAKLERAREIIGAREIGGKH